MADAPETEDIAQIVEKNSCGSLNATQIIPTVSSIHKKNPKQTQQKL